MSFAFHLRRLVRATFFGWIAGGVALLPFQILEAIRNVSAGAASHDASSIEMVGLSILLWAVLTFAVSCYACCLFFAPIVWLLSPGAIAGNRLGWVLSSAAFGFVLMVLRAHVWTAFTHDGVGFTNFWVWSVYSAILFAVTAEIYWRQIRLEGSQVQ